MNPYLKVQISLSNEAAKNERGEPALLRQRRPLGKSRGIYKAPRIVMPEKRGVVVSEEN